MTRHRAVVFVVFALMGCSAPIADDPASWLPRQLGSAPLQYSTRGAETWSNYTICACDLVIEQAGGNLAASTITQGSLARGSLLLTVVRAPGIDPARMLEAMLTHGKLEQISRTDISIGRKRVAVLSLPEWASGPAYLTTSRDTLVLIHDAPEQTAFEFIEALP